VAAALRFACVLAHPDDETLGMGGTLARYASEGIEVHVITATRGQAGRYRDNSAHPGPEALGRIREAELRAAGRVLGVHEVHVLDYMDGSLDRADAAEAAGLIARHLRRIRPQVVATFGPDGAYGHPDHIRTHLVAIGAFERAGDAKAYPEQLGDGVEPWSPSKLYEQAMSRKLRESMNERMAAMGRRSFWLPPEDATPEQIAEHEAFIAKATVPEESITTRVDIGPFIDAKWAAIQRHVTQISSESPFMQMGVEGWRDAWSTEAYVLRETRIPAAAPETDLFAGLTGVS